MKKINKSLLLMLCGLHIIAHAQTSWFVSTTGQDINGNGALNTPFKTVTYASTKASPGDTIFVLAGTYTNTTYGTYNIWKTEQTVKINNFNSTGIPNYLTIKPYNNQLVKFKGDGDFIFQIRNSSYIKVQGFEIEGEVNNIHIDSALKYQFTYKDASSVIANRVAPGTPSLVVSTMTFAVLNNITRPSYFNTIGLIAQNSHHIDLMNNTIHHLPGSGMRVFQGDYINVIGNDIYENSRRSSVGNHGLVFHSSTSIDNNNQAKIIIAKNKVHHNYNEIYSWSELKTFITPHIDEGKGISMQKNTFANGWHKGIIRIENNLTYFNGYSGVHINEGVRMEIVNNTSYYNSYSGGGVNTGISSQQGDTISIYNNISVTDATVSGFAYSSSGGINLVVSNNLMNGIADNDINAVAISTFTGNPQFVNPNTFNFNLQSTSAAINNALASKAPLTDFYNNPRGNSPDIGAVEYISTTHLNSFKANKGISIYPNPFSSSIFITNVSAQKNIELYNAIGQKIQTIQNFDEVKNVEIELSHLDYGIYFVKIENEFYKIIKVN